MNRLELFMDAMDATAFCTIFEAFKVLRVIMRLLKDSDEIYQENFGYDIHLSS